jgi:hypothetical protein
MVLNFSLTTTIIYTKSHTIAHDDIMIGVHYDEIRYVITVTQ